MTVDRLLLWLSARREGSWEQFKGAVEQIIAQPPNYVSDSDINGLQLGLPVYQQLRLNLQRLAHVEFFAGGCENGWRVTPPVVAVAKSDGAWHGILCGARWTALLETLHASHEAIETPASGITGEAPTAITFRTAKLDTLATVLAGCGVRIQRDAPAAILGIAPSVDDRAQRQPAELPIGADWLIEEFSLVDGHWHQVLREDVTMSRGGLYRFTLWHRPMHFHIEKREAFAIDGQVGKYLLLRGKQPVITYDLSRRELSVPATYRPPLLVERALVLCSGTLPHFQTDHRTLTYRDVPGEIATLAAQILHQRTVN